MKNLTSSLIAAAALLVLAANLHSQSILPKSPLDQIKALKAKNVELIEAQKQTLLKLDEMEKTADQIRVLGKRS
jgi:phosphopantothenoylcysteine synthetase/decarboxylase